MYHKSKAVFRGCIDAKSDKTSRVWGEGVEVGIPTFLPMLAKQRNLHCMCHLQFEIPHSADVDTYPIFI